MATLGYQNVEVRVGDGLAGAPDRAPFDRIMVTAAAETVPEALVEQLADDGVMLLPLGPHGGVQHLVKLTKDGRRARAGGAARRALRAAAAGQAREL